MHPVANRGSRAGRYNTDVEANMRNTAAPVLLVVALLVGVAGCTDDTPDAAGPKSRSSTTASGSKTPIAPETPTGTSDPTGDASGDPSGEPQAETSAAPFKGTLLDDGGRGSGNGLGLVGVRTARHRGFDRVVFDLGGAGTPGWRVEYTARPTADGSGEPVTLKGAVFLQVILRGLGAPFDTGIKPFGDDKTRVPATGTEAVAEIAPGGVFEGDQQAFVGLTGTKRPFRVFALTRPARVVVDVRQSR